MENVNSVNKVRKTLMVETGLILDNLDQKTGEIDCHEIGKKKCSLHLKLDKLLPYKENTLREI